VNRLFLLGLVVGLSIFSVATTQAMPLAPVEQPQANLTIPVAGGCGAGFHRGRYGRCRPNAPVAAPGVVVAPPVVVAPARCRRVCNAYGCRRVCK